MIFSSVMATLAWGIDVVPPEVNAKPMHSLYILISSKFVLMLSIPFLFVAGMVFTLDLIVLIIAMNRKRQMSSPVTTSVAFGGSEDSKKFISSRLSRGQSLNKGTLGPNPN